jgi:hypothetical protein
MDSGALANSSRSFSVKLITSSFPLVIRQYLIRFIAKAGKSMGINEPLKGNPSGESEGA